MIRFVVALAVMGCPAAATAQGAMVASSETHIVKHGGSQLHDMKESDAALRATARCVIDRGQGRAEFILGTVPGSAAEVRAIDSLQSRLDWCVPGFGHGGIQAPWMLLRGAFAEELMRRHFPGGMPVQAPKPAASGEAPTPPEDADKVRWMMADAATCAVAQRPAESAVLIHSAVLGQEEARAFAAITPAFSACLDRTVKARFSRQSLRALLAEALYHYADDARGGVGDSPGLASKRGN